MTWLNPCRNLCPEEVNMYSQLVKYISAGATGKVIETIAVVLLILFGFILTARYVIKTTPNYKKENKKNNIYLAIAAVCSVVFLLFLGYLDVELYKALAFILILLYASISDIEERKVPNHISIQLLLLGLANLGMKSLIMHAISGAAIFVFIFIAAMIANGKIGGADVKIISACAFFLGLQPTIIGLICGLFFAVVITLILQKTKKTDDKKLPLVPYLASGFLISYIVITIQTVNP